MAKKQLVSALCLFVFMLVGCFDKKMEKKQSFQPKKSLLKPFPKKLHLGETLTLLPVPHHHFNLKAPQSCGGMKVLKKTAMEIQCDASQEGLQSIVASICDDQVSFCKVEKFEIQVGNSKRKPRSKKSTSDPVKKLPTQPVETSTHFIVNQPKVALQKAKQEDRLLLIDFYGIWCPPCNLLDELVFNQISFQDITRDLVKIKLDADSDHSWEWKNHFRVGGYPTLIIANSDLEEIGRLVGYRSIELVRDWVQSQKVLKDLPIQTLKTQLDHRTPQQSYPPRSYYRVGMWHFERAEYDLASHYFKKSNLRESKKFELLSHLQLFTKESNRRQQRLTLLKLIQRFPDDVRFASWVLELYELDKKPGKNFLQLAIMSSKKWATSSKLRFEDFTPGDLYQKLGQLYALTPQKKSSKIWYQKAANYYENVARKSNLKLARGANLERAYCLLKAGDHLEAKKLYEQMVEFYPNEFTFHYNYAWALFQLKENEKAYEFAKKAQKNAYGDNWIRSVNLMAKIDIALQRQKKAKNDLVKALEQIKLPQYEHVRSHRYVAQLKTLLDTLQ